AVERLAGRPETALTRPSARPESTPTSARADNGASAARIWQESCDPWGTLAERYLRGRGLRLPANCSRFMLFNKSCPFGQERFPALISLIRNIETDKLQAIQRTALNRNGTAVKSNGKTLRMTLGPMVGGAIKIDDDADVTQTLGIGEGLESTL